MDFNAFFSLFFVGLFFIMGTLLLVGGFMGLFYQTFKIK